ncbi:hypothetical protein [Streptomyces atratus]|uniref:hypothetical protein n=1 Tax=Streptomyces atratus TaxID=1893 RepID=UPI00224DE06E|nr:hypothetical protein [Streptomyces atratus]MCX5338485.1 hypothetical protein [Streptomyces atratus]MCX5346162.1 hypothetical protein [Streptomyces atratus]
MAPSTRPTVHYIATRPDGTVPPTDNYLAAYYRDQGETIPTVNLADHVGQVVDFPVKSLCSARTGLGEGPRARPDRPDE